MCTGEPNQEDYFLMCAYPYNQGAAESLCQQYGYDGLASILTQSENDAVQNLSQFITNGTWLSASDVRSENVFLWGTGATMQFTNWFGNHPSVNAFQANCVTMDSNGLWREVQCTQALVGLTCEKRG